MRCHVRSSRGANDIVHCSQACRDVQMARATAALDCRLTRALAPAWTSAAGRLPRLVAVRSYPFHHIPGTLLVMRGRSACDICLRTHFGCYMSLYQACTVAAVCICSLWRCSVTNEEVMRCQLVSFSSGMNIHCNATGCSASGAGFLAFNVLHSGHPDASCAAAGPASNLIHMQASASAAMITVCATACASLSVFQCIPAFRSCSLKSWKMPPVWQRFKPGAKT